MRAVRFLAVLLCLLPSLAFAAGANPPFRLDARLKPLNALLYILGDSRAANAFGANPDQVLARGHAYWLAGLSRGAISVLPVGNGGVSGDTTTQILARTPAAAASPAGITIVIGGVNDPINSVDTATSLANIDAIWSTLNAAGKLQIWRAESPRTSWQANAAQVAQHMAIVNKIASLASRPGTLVFNPWPVGTDLTTGDWRSTGFSLDGTHPDASQALGESRLIWDMLKTIVPPRMVLPSSADDILSATNPTGWYDLNFYFAGTSGTIGANASGTVATGWNVQTSDSALTVTCSVVTLPSGQRAQRIVVSGTPTTANPYMLLNRGHVMANVASGDRMQMWADISIAAGYTGLVDGPHLLLDQTTGIDGITGVTLAGTAANSADPAHSVSDAIDIVLPTPVMTVDNPKPANVIEKIQIPFKPGVAASATIDFKMVGTRKVP